MTTMTTDPQPGASSEDAAIVAAVRAGDEAAFARVAERHRRELHIHCYRMLGSFDEAEDLVQETFLRAWRGRSGLTGGPGVRPWLYKIATNACLDALRRRSRRAQTVDSPADLPWLQPYPDRLLDEVAPSEEQPDAVVVSRETIELAFLALMQLLPARQRAAVILRDVLGWSAKETADLLETSVASANSALQRGRATLDERAPRRDAVAPRTADDLGADERRLLAAFIDAHERADARVVAEIAREDIRVTMPPHPMVYDGLEAIQPLLDRAFSDPGQWRLVPIRANRMPAAASYFRGEDGEFHAFKVDVLRVEGGKVAEITTFDATLFPAFGLSAVLP